MATNDRMAFLEKLRKYLADKDKDFLCESVTVVVNSLIDSEISSIVRTIFAQNDQKSAKLQLRHIVDELKERFPKAMVILEDAEGDVLVYMAFPHEH